MTDIEMTDGPVQTAPMRAPQVVVTTWKGDQDFEAAKPGVPGIHIDSHGNKGPGPMETLLGALAACAMTDVVEILAKRRTPAASLVVETIATRVETTPRRLEHVVMIFRIAGAGIERVHAERAIELAVNKYCSVRSSLDSLIKVEWKLELTP